MNTYQTSDGTRLKKSVIDSLVRKAKQQKLLQQFDEHGYNFREECKVSSGVYLDCSHDESVKSCQENGRAEKAFDTENITILCRKHHQIKDRLNLF